MVKPIPDGYHTVTPYLIVKGAADALDFYKKAFGAEEIVRLPGPDGRVMHAEMRIGDSMVMLGEEALEVGFKSPQELGGSGVSIHLYVADADAAFARAVKAGAEVQMPLADMFWGDRHGRLSDPFGYVWAISTHKEDVPPEEMSARMAAALGGGSGG